MDPLNSDYFSEAYRDYYRQNPAYKLDHYLDQVERAKGNGSLALLDIGCGLGSFLAHMASNRPNWTLSGTDIDTAAVSKTANTVPRASVVQASAEEQPFPDGSFDVITAWDVIEHVADLDAVAASVSRMLRPGGSFFFVVPVYDSPLGWMLRILDRDPTHVHKNSRHFWLGWADTWFPVESWHGTFRYLLGTRYLHFPTRRWRAWAPAILVHCSHPATRRSRRSLESGLRHLPLPRRWQGRTAQPRETSSWGRRDRLGRQTP